MLHRIILILGIANLAGLLIIGFFSLSNTKLVYVDSNKLINGYQGMIDARAVYQKKASSWKANVDTLSSEVQRKIMDYEKESARMTAKEKQLSQELIKTKQKQLYDYQQAMSTQARQEDDKMTGEVITQINTYIKKYGESHNYKVILAATDYGNLAYADESLDITDEVLQGLNKEYKGQ